MGVRLRLKPRPPARNLNAQALEGTASGAFYCPERGNSLVNDFVLAEGCEEILVQEDITVFIGPDKVKRAVFRVDEDEDALPHADPNKFGYVLTFINFVDGNRGVAICDVMSITDLLASASGFEEEAISLA